MCAKRFNHEDRCLQGPSGADKFGVSDSPRFGRRALRGRRSLDRHSRPRRGPDTGLACYPVAVRVVAFVVSKLSLAHRSKTNRARRVATSQRHKVHHGFGPLQIRGPEIYAQRDHPCRQRQGQHHQQNAQRGQRMSAQGISLTLPTCQSRIWCGFVVYGCLQLHKLGDTPTMWQSRGIGMTQSSEGAT